MLRFLQFSVSILLLAWIAFQIDLSETLDYIADFDLSAIWVLIPLLIADRWLMSAKWLMLMRVVGVRLKQWRSFTLYQIAGFVGMFLPATVGADLSRAALLHKEGIEMDAAVSSIVMERILGFAAHIFVCVVSLSYLIVQFADIDIDYAGLLLVTISVALFFLICFLVSFNEPLIQHHILSRLAKKRAIAKIAGYLSNTYATYLGFRSSKLTLAWFFVLSVFEACLLVCIGYVVMVSLGIDVSPAYAFAIISIVTFVVRLPVSIDGFGVYEKGVQYFLSHIGVGLNLGLAAGVLFHFVCLIAMLPGALFLALYKSNDQTKPQTLD